MRTKLFFLAILTTMFFVACSNEELVGESSGEVKPVSINLKVDKAKSRAAISTGTADEDSKINDLIVFVFRNNGDLDAPAIYVNAATLNSTGIPTINGTTMASSIYVVANTGQLSSGAFSNITELSELQRVTLQVDGNPNEDSNCISLNVWMSGSTATLVDDGVSQTGVTQKSATVQLSFVPAKVYVIVKNQMSNYSLTGNTVLQGTAVINGGSWTRFTPDGASGNYRPQRADLTTTTKTPFFYNGVAVDPMRYADQPELYGGNIDYVAKDIYKYTSDAFGINGDFEAIPAAENGFYVFPGITNNATYLTVYGLYSPLGVNDPSVRPYYWSVAFNGADGVLGNLESGKKYIVTITLNGNGNNGGGGDDDPTREVTDVDINVSVQVAQWDVVISEKVIN